MPKKEFESFTRLDASDVNTYLMDQSVMTFGGTAARGSAIPTPVEGMVTYLNDIDALSVYNGTEFVTNRPIMTFGGTAARGSAIPTPVEGMVTYLEDTDQLSIYSGSAWLSPFGLTHIATASVSASTGLIMSNVFSSAYNNYKIIINATGTANSQRLAARLRAGATDYSSTHISGTSNFNIGSTDNTIFRTITTDSIDLGFISAGATIPCVYTFDLSSPFLASQKTYSGTLHSQNGGVVNLAGTLGGYSSDTTSRDGINIFSASNWSGTVRIYGYRNA
jgi:hypothetical protein